ncbi:MAG: flagellar hook-basal body protein [Mariniblastus sp.]
MINGLYSGATALDIFSRQQELISSNLANLQTPGHKRMLFTFNERNKESDGLKTVRPGTQVKTFATDFSQGHLKTTQRPLDVAISGDGFFEFQNGEESVYSRGVPLFRGPEDQLVNGDGMPVLSNGNPISIPREVSDRDITIDTAGVISANGSELGQLNVINFDDNQLLESDSQTYFRQGDATIVEDGDYQVIQGARELSNSHPVTELISLIIGSRHHEAANRAMRAMSEAIQQSVRE